MHGLFLRALQSFLVDTLGAAVWHEVLQRAGLWDEIGTEGFDPLHVYDAGHAPAILQAVVACTGRPVDHLLEDLGTWLVSGRSTQRLRRLLRFGGLTFTEFLGSLDDLQGRARLAVPEIELPALSLAPHGAGRFVLTCHDCPFGLGPVLLGLLRTMADDYGALVVIEPIGALPAADPAQARRDVRLAVEVHDAAYHTGRAFELTLPDPRA